MIIPSRDELLTLLKGKQLSKRMIRELRYAPEDITHANERDFLAVLNKSSSEGVLLFDDTVTHIELSRRRPNSSGRVEAIVCDICATWQRGTASSILTIRRSASHTVSHLVCSDLDCSLHVRNLTDASKLSRTQLREHTTVEVRVKRLNDRLRDIINA